MPDELAVLETAERYLLEHVRPNAQAIDRDPEALREALRGLCDLKLMALRRPQAYGGPAVGEETFRRFQEQCARASGTLAFLQTQHQSAASMIARSDNDPLKDAYLPHMANGEKLVGIGFSQLRRAGPPVIRAEEVHGGYLLTGHVPWVTGWDFFAEFLVGATLPSGEALFAVVPLQEGASADSAVGRLPRTAPTRALRISPPMRLAAMEAANTVTVDFDGYFVPVEHAVFIQPANWIRNNDQINIALQGHFALGCAEAGLDILLQAGEKRPLPAIRATHDALADELSRCREATRNAQASAGEETTQERLEVRAWAIDLAVRCAHAAVAASSGAANSLDHPAQRVYREALVFTVSAQTSQIMEATLERLVRREPSHSG